MTLSAHGAVFTPAAAGGLALLLVAHHRPNDGADDQRQHGADKDRRKRGR